MAAKVIPIQEWLTSFRDAANELAKSSLRFDANTPAANDETPSPSGAYIAILSEKNSVHLGLCAAPSQCRALARGLLRMRHDEELSERDVVDGVSEVMNILAGKVKSQMAGRDGQLQLGLPMFIAQPIQPAGDMETTAADVKLGPVVAKLLVYRRKRAA